MHIDENGISERKIGRIMQGNAKNSKEIDLRTCRKIANTREEQRRNGYTV